MPERTVSLKLRADGLHWREVDGEIVALIGETSTYVAANGTGTALWRRLAEGTTAEELASQLVEEYDVDPEVASKDVTSFVESLRAQGLLEE